LDIAGGLALSKQRSNLDDYPAAHSTDSGPVKHHKAKVPVKSNPRWHQKRTRYGGRRHVASRQRHLRGRTREREEETTMR